MAVNPFAAVQQPAQRYELNTVEHCDGRQIAAPYSEERIPRLLLRLDVVGRPHSLPRRVQELFPRLRTRRVPEQCVVVATAQPIVPGTYVNPQPAGSSSAEVSSDSTMAVADTVGPMTR